MTGPINHDYLEQVFGSGAIDFRQLIDAMPHMLWIASEQQGCEYVNRQWEDYTGVSSARLMGFDWVECIHPDDRQAAKDAWTGATSSGSSFKFVGRLRRHDGEYHWFETRGVPLRNKEGEVVKWFGTNTDVHESVLARDALAANEERLRYVELATRDAIYDWDLRGGITRRNEAFQKHYGSPSQTVVGDKWWEQRVHPDDRQRVLDAATLAFRARSPTWSTEYRFKRADGSYANVIDRGYLLYDAERNPIRMIGAVADISDIKQVEQSLRDAQARLLSAIEGGELSTWTWDIVSGKMTWDEATFRLWGRTPEPNTEIAFDQTIAWIHPDDLPSIQEGIAEFFRTGIATIVEFRVIRPDSKLQWLQVRGQVQRDPDGKPIRMAGVYIDVTERRVSEQSIRDSQDRLLSAMEAGGLATWIWDLKTNELIWDEATCRLWGLPPDAMVRFELTSLRKFIHPDDMERLAALTAEFRRTGVELPIEFRTKRPDGALQWLLAKGRMQRDAQGNVVRMAGVYIDITQRKRNEEAQLRTQKMEALGTLAGGIAHDFNNILLAISGNAKLAMDDLRSALPDEHGARRSLVEIDRASSRAADLVRRILTFSRQQETQLQTVQLRPIIEDGLRLLRPTLPASIEIRTSYAHDVAPVATDAIQIQQVVMNLVTNAAHAIGDGRGTIDIVLSSAVIEGLHDGPTGLLPGRYACLTVSDTGSGIDTEIIDRIFDPFFTTKPTGQGTGLGLAVVHGIVKEHGGAIEVKSDPGKGTQFRLYLPTATQETSSAETTVNATNRGSGERIMYVDDEEPLVFLIARVLERLGYRVTGYIDPEQALTELRSLPRQFDALVTDLSMRGMNGFELTRAVREIRPDLPVLLTSGYLRTEDRALAEQCGIREMILKPNTVEELGQAIDRELRALRNSNTADRRRK